MRALDTLLFGTLAAGSALAAFGFTAVWHAFSSAPTGVSGPAVVQSPLLDQARLDLLSHLIDGGIMTALSSAMAMLIRRWWRDRHGKQGFPLD